MVEAITGTKKIVEGDEHLDHEIKHKNQEKEPLKEEFLTIITTSILSYLPPVIVKGCAVYNLIMVLLSVVAYVNNLTMGYILRLGNVSVVHDLY